MAEVLESGYTAIRFWVPNLPIAEGVVFVSVWVVLAVAFQLLFWHVGIRASNLRIGEKFIPAESFQANEDQWWCSIPEDLLIDQILSRLPVKSLMRFKCVCKTWYSLPTNPSFIASHLKLSNTSSTLAIWNPNNGPIFGSKDFHLFYPCLRSYAFQPVNLNFGFLRKPDLVLGPCDGLFCLFWKPSRYYPPLPTIALWNPATRAFRVLPMSKLDHPPYRTVKTCLVGFGFDLTTKSVKVVKFVGFTALYHELIVNSAEVYNLGSGSWRVLHVDDTAQRVLGFDNPTICVYNNKDGVFHWQAVALRSCPGTTSVFELLVLSFDMSRELFHVTVMPNKYSPFTRHPRMKMKECHFSLFRDSLAVNFSLLYEAGDHATVEIWVMKKDLYRGVEGGESFSYSLSHELTVELPYSRCCISMGFWNENELLLWKWGSDWDLRSGKYAFLYDIVTKQARDMGELNFFMYKESLVSVNGGCGNNTIP